MNRYTIYCTEEQTKKALKLGAPILAFKNAFGSKEIPYFTVRENKEWTLYICPTAEQMRGWLRKEKNIFFTPKKVGDNNYVLIGDLKHFQTYDSYEEAILAGIDISLEYLANKK